MVWVMLDLASTVSTLRRLGTDSPGIEVKSAVGGYPESLDKSLCALANLPGGGLIILGLDESARFKPVGLKNAAILAEGIATKARQSFHPPLMVDIDVRRFEDADVVIALVHEVAISQKPCRLVRDGNAYLRFWDGDYRLSAEEVGGFVANRSSPRFDEVAIDDTGTGDLDQRLLNDFIRNVRTADKRMTLYDDASLLRKMGVITKSGTLALAGLLALGDYPQQQFPNLCIQAALLPVDGTQSAVRVRDTARFTGPIPAMLEAATEWVLQHSAHAIIDRGHGHVTDDYDIPPVAARELIGNALVHRDLAAWSQSRAVELRLTDSVMRLANPGGLHGVPVERLGLIEMSSARNGRLLRICQYISTSDGRAVEALATGLAKVFAVTVGAGRQAPVFFDQGITFTVNLTRGAAPNREGLKLTASDRRAYAALDQPMLLTTLAAKMGTSDETARRAVRRLIDVGLVTRVGGHGIPGTTYSRR